jgi:septal ring-binding cell division protein DamX
VFKLLWLIPLLLSALTACTSNFVPSEVGPKGEYIGWHCEGDVNSQEDWRCAKKAMKDGVLVTMSVSDESVIAEQPPIEESVPVAMPAPIPETAVEEEPTLINSGFTIQLGAFANREVAASVIEGLALEGDIQIINTTVNGQRYSVIIFGRYSSREEAELNTDQLAAKQDNYWIRSMRSLRDAAVQ